MVLHVLHLSGSAVSDFLADLSRLYARDCLAATADPERYVFHVADVSPDGTWRFPAGSGDAALGDAALGDAALGDAALAAAEPVSLAEAVQRLSALRPDVVVPQMFCLPGMTTYRSLLDLLGLPHLGNPAEVMALGADKALARAVVAAAGVSVPAGEVLRPGQAPTLPPPVVVKPVDGDNSLGVTLVRDRGEYPAALEAAFAHSSRVLVEAYVELGREVRCGVLELDGELVALPLEEYAVDAVTKPIRDHADKIGRDPGGALGLVAKDASHAWIVETQEPFVARVQEAARRCYEALGCRQYGLFDFRVDPDGRPWFLEAGLYCSFAEQSVVVMMAAAAGITLPDLFATMIDDALGSVSQPVTGG